MPVPRYDCNVEAVLAMQDHDVGVDDILQYCHALLTNREIRRVIEGLERVCARIDGGAGEEKDLLDDLAELCEQKLQKAGI